jgi:hypothetical protein
VELTDFYLRSCNSLIDRAAEDFKNKSAGSSEDSKTKNHQLSIIMEQQSLDGIDALSYGISPQKVQRNPKNVSNLLQENDTDLAGADFEQILLESDFLNGLHN